ncbi:MAG: response regulator [Desulfobacterales bacterium]|nr:response regulator [Desulfobacterales bacterium]
MSKPTIFIIDDSSQSVHLLTKMLSYYYDIIGETDGYTALSNIQRNPPDLILLDILMSEMDGFEICKKLKSDNKTKNIPVIFLTVLSDYQDRQKGFLAGGVDYITKPFHPDEVILRIQTHLKLYNLQRELEDSKRNLEELVNDRTAQLIKANEQLMHFQRNQRLSALGTLAGGIAHDFNNILSPILGYAELMRESLPKNSDLHDNLKYIFKGIERAKELNKQILMFCRKTEQTLKPLKVHIIIKEALKFSRASLPSTIKIYENIRDCGTVMADPTQIQQIAMNLITNAFHAMEEKGGSLKVSLTKVNLNFEDIKEPDMVPGNYVCLTVADTGIGMDKALIEHIFDPYFTTKEEGKGTGLGLSIVHGIVKSYKGYITVNSQINKGSEFKIYFPQIEETDEFNESQTNDSILKGTERILLVDDEFPIIALLQEILQNLGYKVTAIADSIEALKIFKSNPDLFDLVITDMTMPNMTGEKLSKEMLAIRPDIPIIICTGFSEQIDDIKAKSLGIREYLSKPILLSSLAKAIRSALK